MASRLSGVGVDPTTEAAVKKPRRIRPILMVRVDNSLVPLPRFQRMFDEIYEVSEEYPVIISEERSMSSHRGYFAQLKEAFDNLGEEYANGFPSPEHLRSVALIETGYCTEANFVMDSPREAKMLAVFLRSKSPLSIIRVSGNVVKHFEAESQSVAAMKKERFEASKKAVLEHVASMCRSTPAELKKNAGRSA
jgi:hypothetical protein